ncbi:MAG: ABC transporter substrate-binding protein [Caulobacteraceae bacterium]
MAAASAAHGGPRVLSLDQCADQNVLALSSRADIVGLSKRATKGDSFLAGQAAGLPQRRATIEEVLASRPEVVVRYWGGDARLLTDLRRRGMKVVTIADADDFTGVAADIRVAAQALGARDAGEALVARMERRLARGRGAWRGKRALYLTSGGFTAGKGTLIDAMLRAAGLTNLAGRPGYHSVPLETLVMDPPAAVVEGFFDAALDALQHWSEMRNPLVARIAGGKTIVSLPATILACPAWFAADASLAIAERAPSRR